jgi:hypothetical protein
MFPEYLLNIENVIGVCIDCGEEGSRQCSGNCYLEGTEEARKQIVLG